MGNFFNIKYNLIAIFINFHDFFNKLGSADITFLMISTETVVETSVFCYHQTRLIPQEDFI